MTENDESGRPGGWCDSGPSRGDMSGVPMVAVLLRSLDDGVLEMVPLPLGRTSPAGTAASVPTSATVRLPRPPSLASSADSTDDSDSNEECGLRTCNRLAAITLSTSGGPGARRQQGRALSSEQRLQDRIG